MTRNRRGGRVWRLLSVLAALALVVAACGDDTGGDGGDGDAGSGLLAELQESGTITVGVAGEAPYGFVDENGNVAGAAPAVAQVVLEELGITNMEAEVVEFGALIGGLQAGNFDMITAGMYITPDRADDIYFSDPDYCIQDSMLVEEGNPFGLTDYPSVAETDAVLAVASGTVNPDYAVWAGIPEDQIEEFAGIEDQYDAIAAGRVDAVSGTILTVQAHADAMDGFEALPPFDPVDENGDPILGCGGHGFLDLEFRNAFNDVLNELQEEGVVQELVNENLTEGAIDVAAPAVDLTVQDLTGCEEVQCPPQ